MIRPFWRFYGGKWRAAPKYPKPELNTIIEPFAGAAGYSCRYPNSRVILIDADPVIAATWRYLIATPASEILAIPDIPHGGTVDDLTVCQEARWLVGWWCNAGSTEPKKSPSKWAHFKGVHNWGGWCDKSRNRIAKSVEFIRHWKILEGDYRIAPDIEATWFIDPPYQTVAGRCYRKQPDSFIDLGIWAQKRKGQIIACDQVGANWLPWTSNINVKSAKSRQSSEVFYHRSIHPKLFKDC